jgi:hypothetical protein
MRLVVSWLAWLGVLLAAVAAAGAEEKSRPLKATEIPRMLFHWTSAESLSMLAQRANDAGKKPGAPIQLKRVAYASVVGETVPGMGGREGIFAWSHPVTGMAKGGDETYAPVTWWGDKEETLKPALIAMKIAPNARAALVVTALGEQPNLSKIDLSNVDLILHRRYSRASPGVRGPLDFQEWIVVNPRAVKSYTSDPAALRKLLEPELAHLEDKSYRFRPEELHAQSAGFNNPEWRKGYVPTVRALLATPRRDVPIFFRNPIASKPRFVNVRGGVPGEETCCSGDSKAHRSPASGGSIDMERSVKRPRRFIYRVSRSLLRSPRR